MMTTASIKQHRVERKPMSIQIAWYDGSDFKEYGEGGVVICFGDAQIPIAKQNIEEFIAAMRGIYDTVKEWK